MSKRIHENSKQAILWIAICLLFVFSILGLSYNFIVMGEQKTYKSQKSDISKPYTITILANTTTNEKPIVLADRGCIGTRNA